MIAPARPFPIEVPELPAGTISAELADLLADILLDAVEDEEAKQVSQFKRPDTGQRPGRP